VVDPGREVSARRGGVFSGQVDRIGNAVEGEGDRLFRGLVPVEIVEVVHGRRLCHSREVSPAFRAIDGGIRLRIISRRPRNCTGDGTSEGSEDVPVSPDQPATATRGHRRSTVARGRSPFARVAIRLWPPGDESHSASDGLGRGTSSSAGGHGRPSVLNEKVVGSIPTGGSTFGKVRTYDCPFEVVVAGPKMPSDATSGLQVGTK